MKNGTEREADGLGIMADAMGKYDGDLLEDLSGLAAGTSSGTGSGAWKWYEE